MEGGRREKEGARSERGDGRRRQEEEGGEERRKVRREELRGVANPVQGFYTFRDADHKRNLTLWISL